MNPEIINNLMVLAYLIGGTAGIAWLMGWALKRFVPRPVGALVAEPMSVPLNGHSDGQALASGTRLSPTLGQPCETQDYCRGKFPRRRSLAAWKTRSSR